MRLLVTLPAAGVVTRIESEIKGRLPVSPVNRRLYGSHKGGRRYELRLVERPLSMSHCHARVAVLGQTECGTEVRVSFFRGSALAGLFAAAVGLLAVFLVPPELPNSREISLVLGLGCAAFGLPLLVVDRREGNRIWSRLVEILPEIRPAA